MSELTERAKKYLLAERANRGYYTDSVEVLDIVEELIDELDQYQKDAERYQYLRNTDIDAVHKGGIFAGQTPQNLVINGEDLDDEIDKALAQIKETNDGYIKSRV